MSDFSSGILIHKNHREIAKTHREDNSYLIKLNDAWLCRLSKNDFRGMDVENYSEAVLNMSLQIPLLHVINAEDHGVELGILHQKKFGFHFHVPYGVEYTFAFDIGMALYGDHYMEVIMDQAVQEKIQNEVQSRHHEVEEMLNGFFSEVNEETIAQFQLFGVDHDTCVKIGSILTAANYQIDRTGHKMINELFTVLKLLEFSFISHEYVNMDESIFDIVG